MGDSVIGVGLSLFEAAFRGSGGAALVTHTITASAGAHGSISPLGAVAVSDGGNQQFSFSADPSYAVLSVTVDGSPASTTSPYTFTNVTEGHTIAVAFVYVEAIVRTALGYATTLTNQITKTGVSVEAGSYLFVAIGLTNNNGSALTPIISQEPQVVGLLLDGVGGFSNVVFIPEFPWFPVNFGASLLYLVYRYCPTALSNVSLVLSLANDGNDPGGTAPSCMLLTQVKGLAPSAVYDLHAVANGQGTSPSSGATATPSQAHEFFIGLMAGDGSNPQAEGTWASPLSSGQYVEASFEDEDPVAYISLGEGYYIQTAAAARTAAVTGRDSQYWGAVVVGFKGA